MVDGSRCRTKFAWRGDKIPLPTYPLANKFYDDVVTGFEKYHQPFTLKIFKVRAYTNFV